MLQVGGVEVLYRLGVQPLRQFLEGLVLVARGGCPGVARLKFFLLPRRQGGANLIQIFLFSAHLVRLQRGVDRLELSAPGFADKKRARQPFFMLDQIFAHATTSCCDGRQPAAKHVHQALESP